MAAVLDIMPVLGTGLVLSPWAVIAATGLHSLATLVSRFLGVQLFGVLGLFVLPAALSLLALFRRDGVLPPPSWMRKPA